MKSRIQSFSADYASSRAPTRLRVPAESPIPHRLCGSVRPSAVESLKAMGDSRSKSSPASDASYSHHGLSGGPGFGPRSGVAAVGPASGASLSQLNSPKATMARSAMKARPRPMANASLMSRSFEAKSRAIPRPSQDSEYHGISVIGMSAKLSPILRTTRPMALSAPPTTSPCRRLKLVCLLAPVKNLAQHSSGRVSSGCK